MSFDDFFTNFHQLHICHRGPASLGTTEEDANACTWNNLFRVRVFVRTTKNIYIQN
jgi:hypothetical protein